MATRAERRRARAIGAIATGVAAGLVVFVLATLLAWASLGVDNARLLGEVRAGFADHSLDPAASGLFGNTDIGVQQFNDCLVLFQSVDDRASRADRTISPLSINPGRPGAAGTPGACLQLSRLVSGATTASPHFYHRYVHAQTSLARMLVPLFGVAGTRELYRLCLSILLLAAIGYPMAALARGARVGSNGVFLVVAVVFARCFGLEGFGQSLAHAPADAVAIALLLFLARASAQRPLTRRTATVAAALFGGATMAFELLTGGLPLGLAMLLGLVPIALADEDHVLTATGEAVLAYGAAAAACLFAKFALAAGVFGAATLTDNAGQLMFRLGLSAAPIDQPPGGPASFLLHLWAGLDALAPGLRWFSMGLIVLAIVAGGWGYRVLRRDECRHARRRALALAWSAFVPVLWLLVFWQHSAEHAWFMDRVLVWPIAAAAALFTLAVCADRDRPARAATDRRAA